jgi:hypothetical protein
MPARRSDRCSANGIVASWQEQEQERLLDQRATGCDALALTAGHLRRPAIEQRLRLI